MSPLKKRYYTCDHRLMMIDADRAVEALSRAEDRDPLDLGTNQ